MKNMKYKAADAAGLVLALPVPSTAVIGRPVALGTAGLFGIPITDRVTAALRTAGRAPQGLKDGQASTLMPGIGCAIDLGTPPSGAQLFSKVYQAADGTTLTATNTDLFVGYLLPGNLIGIRSN